MKVRTSILAKILFWFFGNVVLIAALALLVFPARIGVGAQGVLEAQTRQRVLTLARFLTTELEKVEQAEWGSKLNELRDVYDVDLILFAPWGEPLAATEPGPEIPEAVKKRMEDLAGGPRGQRGRGPRREGRERRMGVSPADDRPDADDPAQGAGEGDFASFALPPERESGDRPRDPELRRGRGPAPGTPFFSMRAGAPLAHWAAIIIPLADVPERPPHPFKLVIRSNLDADNGLFFDARPWINLAIGLALVSILWWLPLVRHITRPLRAMSAATGQIARGRFDVRVDERRRDEIGSLGASINAMAGRLDGYVTGQRRFLGDIAHELGSPIGRVQMALGIIEQRCEPQSKERVADAMEDLSRLAALVNELLSFTRAEINPERVRREVTALRPIVRAALDRECPADWERVVDVPGDLTVMADEGLLTRAIANVVRNAAKYAAPPIEVRAGAEDGTVILEIRDHGPGVPEAALPHLFEPFYRPDAARSEDTGGVGLGLAIVKTCVRASGGEVSAASANPGFMIRIRLDEA